MKIPVFINKNTHEHKLIYIHVKRDIRERQRKASPAEFHSKMKLKTYTTIVEEDQRMKVTRLPAEPFMFTGYI